MDLGIGRGKESRWTERETELMNRLKREGREWTDG